MPDSDVVHEYLTDELMKWGYMVKLFSDRDGRVVIDGVDHTLNYGVWAAKNLGYAVAAMEAYKDRMRLEEAEKHR